MLFNTKGIVLRAVKYGETSLILSVFTERAGLQSYIVKGIRSEKAKSKRAGLLQPTSLIELTAEHKPGKSLQHIREFQPAYLYQSMQEQIIKHAIAIFSAELLLRLLPEGETMEDLFDFAFGFFRQLDGAGLAEVANFPLFFTITCGKHLGYNISGTYSEDTPYLDAQEGMFTANPPSQSTALQQDDVSALAQLILVNDLAGLAQLKWGAALRNRLLDWYLAFLQHHTQHLAHIRSLDILRAILH